MRTTNITTISGVTSMEPSSDSWPLFSFTTAFPCGILVLQSNKSIVKAWYMYFSMLNDLTDRLHAPSKRIQFINANRGNALLRGLKSCPRVYEEVTTDQHFLEFNFVCRLYRIFSHLLFGEKGKR